MLKQLLGRIQKILAQPTYQNELDRYIASKNPTSVGEIEHWVKMFDKRQGGLHGF